MFLSHDIYEAMLYGYAKKIPALLRLGEGAGKNGEEFRR